MREDSYVKKRIPVVIVAVILAAAVCIGLYLFFFADKTVGSSVSFDQLGEFTYSYYSTAFPAENIEYKFIRKGEGWTYNYKHLKGEHLPLTDADLIESSGCELDAGQISKFYSLLGSGKISRHKESVESGGAGPWYIVRFEGDMDIFTDYSFASYDKEQDFLQFCIEIS